MKNEFEEMYGEEEFSIEDLESSDYKEKNSTSADDLVYENKELEYDFTKAPTSTGKKIERKDLDGKTVTITDAKIILPSPDSEWQLSRNKQTRYKNCQFKVFYDDEGQFEYYSGVKVFPVKTPKGEQYSQPSIYNKSKNQAATLKKTYAEHAGKEVEKVSMYEFLNFLKNNPKAKIVKQEFEYDEVVVHKNMIEKFIKQ